eukprot:gene16965-57708_t
MTVQAAVVHPARLPRIRSGGVTDHNRLFTSVVYTFSAALTRARVLC